MVLDVAGNCSFYGTTARGGDRRHKAPSEPQLFSQAYLAAAYAQLGEDAAMSGAAAEVMRLRPDFSVAAFVFTEPYKVAADREHLADSLRKAGLPE